MIAIVLSEFNRCMAQGICRNFHAPFSQLFKSLPQLFHFSAATF
jgi:hypothetical protein